jgi:hypothetical protein
MSHRQRQCVRRDTMGGERQYTMLRLSQVSRELAVPSQRSPATLRLKTAIRLEKRRASVVKRVPLKTARIGVNRIPDCPAPGRSRATRPVPAGMSDGFPCRGLRDAGPACCRMPSDLFTSNPDPTPAHPPRVSFASPEIVTNNKTTPGSPLRISLISAGRRPLTVGEGQGSASRDRFTLSSFARTPIDCDPARRLRLEAGFAPAVYDTSYQGPPPIRQTR